MLPYRFLVTLFVAAIFNVAYAGKPSLWIAKNCAFSSRAWVCALEKNVDVDMNFVDLSNKPPEFVSLYQSVSPDESAGAKSPVFEDKDHDVKLIESAIIAQYISDAYPSNGETSLNGNSFAESAIIRLFSDTYDKTLEKMRFRIVRTPYAELEQKTYASDLEAAMKVLEKFLVMYQLDDGPFLLGRRFSMAEVLHGPFIMRIIPALHEFAKLDLMEECERVGCTRLGKWAAAVAARESIKTVALPEEDVVAEYMKVRERVLGENERKS